MRSLLPSISCWIVTMVLDVGMSNAQSVTGITMVDSENHPLLDLDSQPVADPINSHQTIFLNRLTSTSFSFQANTAGALSLPVDGDNELSPGFGTVLVQPEPKMPVGGFLEPVEWRRRSRIKKEFCSRP